MSEVKKIVIDTKGNVVEVSRAINSKNRISEWE
jgi:hypothetical protein